MRQPVKDREPTLPLVRPAGVARDHVLTRVEQPTPSPAPTVRRLKVLIVDDNEEFVDMLALMVGAIGHDVRKAHDGPGAVAAAMSYRPDVILLDLGLPGLSGLEVTRELRGRPEMVGTRVVAMTGWGQDEVQKQTADAGFDCHLTKPTDPQTLERLLAEFAAAATPPVAPSTPTGR